ncbi:multidrug transporter [Paenibacillus sp. FSL R7-0273]|uniref:DMT family transporter n=1 Tax=Paenibacillus sp. FSL R7-0273 TaxID=1536772 RepID=UPI0004F62162|nr:DMT family transporter [Paenibacillus sp. FSL R7-0273]AIQ47048.1 multidrug transporter [Paenibacillus sp. FSL R7-0273]OMF97197.1 EamA family transporter [Paenibacillus sp. FSL R7-0273]
MKPLKAELLLLMVTLFWGSSYIFMKMGLGSLGEFNLIALRFGLAFVLAAALFHKRLRSINLRTLQYGALLGALLFGVFTCITFGLQTTTTSNAGFLVALTVVFVPLLEVLVFRKKVAPPQVFGTALAIAGIGLLTLNTSLSIQPGDFLCILAALFYAVQILVTSKAVKSCDSLNIGILQLGFAGGYALVFSIIFETPAFPSSMPGWIAILALGILCSACGFILQPVAQKFTTPTRTGLIFSLEPVFAAFFGYWFAGEQLSMQGYAGAALVMLGIVASELLGKMPAVHHPLRSFRKRRADL